MDYEKEYSPSEWSIRYDTEIVVDNFFKTIETQTKSCGFNGAERKSFPLGGSEPNNILDAYPSIDKTAIGYIFVPGGYWQASNHRSYSFVGEQIMKFANVNFGIVSYEVSPKQSIKSQIEVTKKAIEKFCLEFPECRAIVLAGHSAGAHLIAMTLQNLDLKIPIRQIFLISGIYDLVPLTKMSVMNNPDLTMSASEVMDISPINKITKIGKSISNQASISRSKQDILNCENSSMCIVNLLVGEYESNEFKRQSKIFRERLLEVNEKLDVQYQEITGVDHFDEIENLYFSDYRVTQQIIRACGGRMSRFK